ncbi:MAG: hypothetical protein ABSD62_14050 [Candidatus Limnocylindrales bacterium]
MSRGHRASTPGIFVTFGGWSTKHGGPGPTGQVRSSTGGVNPSTDLTLWCYPKDDEQFRADVVRAISECRGKVWPNRKLAGAVQVMLASRYPKAFVSAQNPLAWCEAVDIWYCYRDGPFG